MDELRLHAMGLSAGLSTTIPDPEGCDGTEVALQENVLRSPAFIDTADKAEKSILPWWVLELFWPVLHIASSTLIGLIQFGVHYTLDLLNNFKILGVNGTTPEEQYVLEYLVITALAVGLANAAYQIGLGMLAVAEYCIRSPEPVSKWVVAGAISLLVITTAAVVLLCNTKLNSGEWHYGHAFAYYLAFAILFFYYWCGTKSLIGFASKAVLGLLLLDMGCSLENLHWNMVEMANPGRWTKIIILFLLMFFLVMAGTYFILIFG